MSHGFLCCKTRREIVDKKTIKEGQGFRGTKMFDLGRDKRGPGLARLAQKLLQEGGFQREVVLLEELDEVLCSEDTNDPDELVSVVTAVEERLTAEDDAGEHATKGPHVQAVVVVLEVDEQFWALEVAGCDTNVVEGSRDVEFGETPVDEAQRTALVIDHDVVRLDITVHDTAGVAVVKGTKKLVDVVAHIVVGECGIERLEVDVIDVFLNEAWGLCQRLNDDIQQMDDVGSASEILQDLDLTEDLLLLDRLEHFDDAWFLSISHDTSFKHFTVLSTTNFTHDLVIVLTAPLDLERFIV